MPQLREYQTEAASKTHCLDRLVYLMSGEARPFLRKDKQAPELAYLFEDGFQDNFWAKILIGNDCWEWTAAKHEHGYGMIGNPIKRCRVLRAHRVMYALAYGEMPKLLRHTCDNPGCVRPDHLIPGTMKQNTQDCIERGRFKFRPGQPGELNPAAKLTKEQVILARQEYEKAGKVRGFQKKYAEKIGISTAQMSKILRNEAYVT